MDRDLRKKILVANKIHAQLLLLERQRYESLARRLEHLLDSIEDFKANYNKLRLCLSKNWMAGAQQVSLRNLRKGDNLYHDVCEIKSKAEKCAGNIPPVREIYAELIQAESEFESSEIDDSASTISVETDVIELDDIYLGRFQIKLYIDSIGDRHTSSTYKIIALDPHPASCNDSVTHPHVRDEYLCEGEATEAIAAALTGGRICDFFTLVNSVLNTYNSGSPYVSLNDWEGESCYECGTSVHDDERYYCHQCENDFCDYCSSYCRICDQSTCLQCLTKCPICDEQVCKSCLTSCPDCSQILCVSCLEQNMCPCKQEPEENEDDPETINSDDQHDGTGSQTDSPNVAA